MAWYQKHKVEARQVPTRENYADDEQFVVALEEVAQWAGGVVDLNDGGDIVIEDEWDVQICQQGCWVIKDEFGLVIDCEYPTLFAEDYDLVEE